MKVSIFQLVTMKGSRDFIKPMVESYLVQMHQRLKLDVKKTSEKTQLGQDS